MSATAGNSPSKGRARGDAEKPRGSSRTRNKDFRGADVRPRRRRLRILIGVLVVAAAALGISRWLFPRQDVEQLFRQAVAAAEQGENARAASILDKVLVREPDHYEARLYRGQVARDLGNRDEALRNWQAVPDSPPKFGAVARYLEGTATLEADRAVEAEMLLRRAAELNPNYLQPRERLLELYVVQMRGADIRDQLDALRFLRPWKLEELVLYSVAGQRLQDTDDAIKRMERFVKADRGDVFSATALVRYYLEGERLDRAAELADRLLKQMGSNHYVLGLLTEVYLRQSDLAAAARSLARVDAARPLDAVFLRSCGSYWSMRGDHERAAASLSQAVIADPEDLATQQRLGTELSRLGRHEQAVVHLRQAELIDRVLRQASRIPRRDRKNDQLLVPIVLDVADALMELKRYDESVHWYDQALRLQPGAAKANEGIRRVAQMIRADPSLVDKVADNHPRAVAAAPETLRFIIPDRTAAPPEIAVAETSKELRTIKLRDVHAEAGIDFQYFNGQTGLKYLVESMGGGVAVLDFDNDGWPDLYFSQGCALPFDAKNRDHLDRLFRNLGNGRFQDVTASAGLGDAQYGQGCVAGDYDNDGDSDLVVANFGENVFYRNNGDGTFSDVTAETRLAGSKWSSSLALADLDRDGDLDLYIVTYVDSLRVCHGQNGRIATCDPQNFDAEQDRLLCNRGDGTFEDVSRSAGILAPDGKGLGIIIADLDNDSWSDIYIANDGTPNFMFRNRGAEGSLLTFESCGMLSGTAVNGDGQAQGGMGIACADFEGDGLLDLFVTNFYLESSTMYRNRGDLYFDDVTQTTKIKAATRPMVGFGVQAIDFDLDGRQDLITGNGHIDDFRFRNEPWKMPTLLFQGNGDGSFRDTSREAGPYFHGEYLGRGVARLDWDRDADPDVVVVHQDTQVALLKNESETGNRIVLELHGVVSNRDALGARVYVVTAQGRQLLEWMAGDGFFSSNERRMIAGLGSADRASEVEIVWPTGEHVKLSDVPANSRVLAVEGQPPRIVPLDRESPGEM